MRYVGVCVCMCAVCTRMEVGIECETVTDWHPLPIYQSSVNLELYAHQGLLSMFSLTVSPHAVAPCCTLGHMYVAVRMGYMYRHTQASVL